jgi:hypothetical protein
VGGMSASAWKRCARNLASELASSTDRSAQANDLLGRQRDLLRPQIDRLVAAAAPIDDAEIARHEAEACKAETTGTDRVTSRIPNTPMRTVLQTETKLNSTYPPRDAVAKVQVDYFKAWKYVL